jgi:hypothetical protein
VPIARYFMVVGSALVALLLIAGWCLPEPPPSFPDHPEIDRATIRIRSERKWPQKVVLDTSQPTSCLSGRLRERPQFPPNQITNGQDYYGCARYPEITMAIACTVEPIEASDR